MIELAKRFLRGFFVTSGILLLITFAVNPRSPLVTVGLLFVYVGSLLHTSIVCRRKEE
jgi:hypothetical protein